MCRIEYADDDGMWLQEPHAVKSRKDHKCDDCGRAIVKDETYHYGVWLTEGDLMTVKMCAHCVAAGRWLKKVCGGHMWPGVIEELEEHWDEEFDLRSHGLGCLVTVGKSRWMRKGELVPVERIERWVDGALSRVPESAMH